jgi:DNA polymerase (family 10)
MRRELEAIHDAGAWVLVEAAIADLPSDLRALLDSGAVTLDQLGRLHTSLDVVAAADIAAVTDEEAVGPLVGADAAAAIRTVLPQLRARAPGIPLGRADALARRVLDPLRAHPDIAWAQPDGSLRRGDELVVDIMLLAPGEAPTHALDDIAGLERVEGVRHRGARRLTIVIDGAQIDIRTPAPHDGEAALLYLTGSRAHVAALQTMAARSGLRLGLGGLRTSEGRTIATSEEAIYRTLGLPFIDPELRIGASIIDEAQQRRLPRLITGSDIRGDLHVHTHWSDGRDSVEAMTAAAVALGYEYLAITDHSPSSSASRSLTLDGVARQADEIARVRERYPQIAILHGCEVDILPDGGLDFPDRVLKGFDIVLASLHDSAGHSPAQLLERYRSAMQHPLVSVITHPSHRQIARRPGYDLDFDALFESAHETGTVLEIDGAPSHLDLDAGLARRAAVANVLLSIDSDAHRREALGVHMHLGLLLARRGRIEATHVLNTRSYREVQAILASKRLGIGR